MASMSVEQAVGLALGHHQAGRLADAEQLYRQVLSQQPNHPDALHLLGVLAHQVGRNDVAVPMIRNAIAARPHFPEAYNNLANALMDLGQFDQAVAACQHAVALRPAFAEAYCSLGNALKEKGQFTDAIAAYRQALALRPGLAEAHCNLGDILRAQGRLEESIAAHREAIAIRPTDATTQFKIGVSLTLLGRSQEAIQTYHRAVELNPVHAEAQNNLGIVLRDTGNPDEAITALRQAVALKPASAEFACNLGNALKDQGLLDEALAEFRKALELSPSFAEAHSNLLLAMHSQEDYDAARVADEHRRWARTHAEPLAKPIRTHANDRDPDRRLRVGYVSADLRDHPVGRFLLPLLENHDPGVVEVVAYSRSSIEDAVTDRLRANVRLWRKLPGNFGPDWERQIQDDRIDILVDLAGHTSGNALLLFARKPAPVQVTYLGYPATTGLRTIDYRFTDGYCDPPGQTDLLHSEQLQRLSPCAWCFWPLHEVPVPQRVESAVVFGCFNALSKITEPMLNRWAQILHGVPGSRLMLKSAGLNGATARQRISRVMADAGVDPQRLDFPGYKPAAQSHLGLYGRMDIALDTYPYHGTTTTCEALWMGAAVITLAGPSHVCRVGVSLLSNVGLAELIAESSEQYVRIAVELAHDLPRLRALQKTLRQRMEQSPLTDGVRLAQNVEMAYRQMWKAWCSGV